MRAQAPTFRAAIDMVLLNVSVTDKAGRPVLDLQPDEFSVFEDGRPQHVKYFQRSDVPMLTMLLVDVSGSMSVSLGAAQQASLGFVRSLGPSDLASVVPFESQMHPLVSFTRDEKALETAIRQIRAGGNTALYDTVYIALKELRRAGIEAEADGHPRRQAILLLTDGYDSSSLMGFDDTMDAAIRSDVAIYVIRLPGSRFARPRGVETPDFVLGRFANQTGGRVYRSEEPSMLTGIYRQIKGELSSQYLLAYRSDDQRRDGRFRQIAIRLARAGLITRTRPGYVAEGTKMTE